MEVVSRGLNHVEMEVYNDSRLKKVLNSEQDLRMILLGIVN